MRIDDDLQRNLTRWRRHLHQNPELSFEEHETSAFVCEKLAEMGVPFVAGVGKTGVVATLSRGSGPSVGLRADMDALPIHETTNLPYASRREGVMHACGHDGHTTSLLGAALLLKADPSWAGTIHLVFQPAEEKIGGSLSMINDGLFSRFPMDRVFAFHNWPGLEAGTVMVHSGPVMASATRIDITLHGHAAHAAMPHLSRDPIVAAGHLLIALQTVVSRNMDPFKSAVVSIGMMQAGHVINQIAQSATLGGTLRAHDEHVRDQLEEGVRRIVEGVAQTYGVEAECRLTRGSTVTVNSADGTRIAVDACHMAGIPVRDDLDPSMAGEDFSWFLKNKPGALVWIGNGPVSPGRELHSSSYDFNDEILPASCTWLASVAKASLRDQAPVKGSER